MMQLVVFSAVVAVAFGAFSGDPKTAQIIRSESDISPEGNYQWAYETENGIAANEEGALKNIGSGAEAAAAIVAQGSYKYESPEGEQISIQYVADENGYQPVGAALPTSPPIPAAIQRALEYIQAHPPQEERSNKF